MDSDAYIEIFHKLVSLAEEYKTKAESRGGKCEPGYFAVVMYVKNASPELQKMAELEFVKMVQALGGKYVPGHVKLVREAAIKLRDAPEKAGGEHLLLRLSLGRLVEACGPEWRGPARKHEHFLKKYPNHEEAFAKYWWQQWCLQDREETGRTITAKCKTLLRWRKRSR